MLPTPRKGTRVLNSQKFHRRDTQMEKPWITPFPAGNLVTLGFK